VPAKSVFFEALNFVQREKTAHGAHGRINHAIERRVGPSFEPFQVEEILSFPKISKYISHPLNHFPRLTPLRRLIRW
jgi:hypothetical protein